MTYIPDLLSLDEQTTALQEIDKRPWRDDLKRRVQHYGYVYDYKARRVDKSMYLGQLPDFALNVAAKLTHILPKQPDQLIVNEYLPGQGISAHIDCEPCFDDYITTVSLGWTYQIEFIHPIWKDSESLLLELGSALIITDEARYQWLHLIRTRKSDNGIQRQRRVSMTFRNVIIE